MNFRQKSRNLKRSRGFEFAVVASVFVVGALTLLYMGGPILNFISPIWRSNNRLSHGLTNIYESLRSKDALIVENEHLKARLLTNDELVLSLQAVSSSRDELLSSFGRSFESGIAGSVLVHPPETPYDILLIDIGENLGVKPLSEVMTPEGSSIGVVSEVFSHTARVRLYSTAGERTDAILERGGVPVTLVGRGGGNLEFTLPKDTDVKVGDRIITSNLDAALLGVVGSVDTTPTGSFKTILVRSPINPSALWHILIRR